MRKGTPTRHPTTRVMRTYVRLDADERSKIDAWGFERHIAARSERLRALIFKGLESESMGRNGALSG